MELTDQQKTQIEMLVARGFNIEVALIGVIAQNQYPKAIEILAGLVQPMETKVTSDMDLDDQKGRIQKALVDLRGNRDLASVQRSIGLKRMLAKMS